jgi:hypothetical protein
MEQAFKGFKTKFAEQLTKAENLDIQDVIHLIQPLAQEEITDKKVWDKFA